MKSQLSALVIGILFGTGLVISGMTDTSKVKGFLDITGAWDYRLAFVMMGAIGVYGIAWWKRTMMRKPLFAEAFFEQSYFKIDAKLIVGAAIFGIGWGLGGYCPGPALVSLGTGKQEAIIFCAAVFLGMKIETVRDTLMNKQKKEN